jgi:hypothetical protein
LLPRDGIVIRKCVAARVLGINLTNRTGTSPVTTQTVV